MLLNEYLSDYHFSEKHKINIDATSSQILQAIIDLSPGEISFLFSFLFFLRSIPPKLLGRRYIGFDSDNPLLKQLEDKGFKILEINDHEIVLGVIGQFGKMRNGEIHKINDFKNFNEKESGKVATNFYLTGNEDKVTLSTRVVP